MLFVDMLDTALPSISHLTVCLLLLVVSILSLGLFPFVRLAVWLQSPWMLLFHPSCLFKKKCFKEGGHPCRFVIFPVSFSFPSSPQWLCAFQPFSLSIFFISSTVLLFPPLWAEEPQCLLLTFSYHLSPSHHSHYLPLLSVIFSRLPVSPLLSVLLTRHLSVTVSSLFSFSCRQQVKFGIPSPPALPHYPYTLLYRLIRGAELFLLHLLVQPLPSLATHLVSLSTHVCLIMAECDFKDTYCNRNNNKRGFKYFLWCTE